MLYSVRPKAVRSSAALLYSHLPCAAFCAAHTFTRSPTSASRASDMPLSGLNAPVLLSISATVSLTY